MTNNYDLEKIFNYVHSLEKRLTKLESKEAVIVTGGLKNKQPKPLTISLEKLIDIYNDVPQILTEYVVELALTAESYRQKTDGKVILEYIIQGNYWVILLENLVEKNYYLFLNSNKKLKLHRLKSIEYLFNLQGEKIIETHEFILLKLALISIFPNGKQWQLKDKGLLHIGKKSPASRLVSELEKIADDEGQIPASLQELLASLETLNKHKLELKAEIQSLQNRLTKLEPEYSQLVNLYHDEPQYFVMGAGGSQKVKVTDETMNTVLQGKFNAIHLEVSPEGEYLIKKAGHSQYLFPNPDVIFDKMTLTFAHQARLFICQGHIPIGIKGIDIKIQKPAKVKQTENLWLVIESGEVIL